ncbi:SPX domain-containing protein [Coprinopsis sp. MPI-PUGE-AT-0042]|nr:SPX domain-containing protein [Coprinopsis sp. MPI-PUGE-AT-0042]
MKFSASLKFNAVSDWWEEYIAYDTLKKYIYQLEKQQHKHEAIQPRDVESGEYASLLSEQQPTETDAAFAPLLDLELKKIIFFYETQSKELFDELEELEEAVRQQEELGALGLARYEDYSEGEDDEDDDSISRSPTHATRRSSVNRTISRQRRATLSDNGSRRASITSNEDRTGNGMTESQGTLSRLVNSFRDSFAGEHSIWTSGSDYAYDTRLLFKRRITTLYISFTNLKSYVEVNYSGFRKILKKYDKVTYSELKDRYLHEVVEPTLPFMPTSKDKLNADINKLVELYAKCVTRGDRNLAKEQLKLNQRENIAWERDTVWRQMIGRERRGEGDPKLDGAVLVKEPERPVIDVNTPVGRFKVTRRKIYILIAVAVFVTLLNVNVVDGTPANNCFAILTFCTILWATEAIPLFVTSLFVPLLLVWLRVMLNEDGERMSTPDATHKVFSLMFSPTIMLLIGGFTISSALSKTNIDRILITRVLHLAGTKPSRVLLAFMGVSCFASMWISNVAAPTLCFTLIRPILRTLPPKSAFGPCLILAIALAANIGGQSSPISSPQNLIALAAMEPTLDWGKWFAVALPVSAISIILIWLLLLVSYQPSRMPGGDGEIEIKPIRPTREPFTLKQYWVSFVCLGTIALWCFEHKLEPLVGDMGVIAIIPIVAFFSTGVLKKDDFEHFAWTIVFLAMGGIALGKGVVSSGLLTVLDAEIQKLLNGFSLYTVVLILSPVALVISTFISHTIASVLLVPIAKEVGSNLPGQPKNLLIFITALICSAGMGMPVSGFPNQTAATQEDELGELYLSNVDFLKNGVPASIIATAVVATVGFALMKAIGIMGTRTPIMGIPIDWQSFRPTKGCGAPFEKAAHLEWPS